LRGIVRADRADIRISGDKAYYDVAGDYIRRRRPSMSRSTGTEHLYMN
jgi:antirestriction protein ArdC